MRVSIFVGVIRDRPRFPADLLPDFSPFKIEYLKDISRHAFKATNACAFAYSYARIRRLVRLGVGPYRGSVADESMIGFSDSSLCRRTSAANSIADTLSATDVMAAVRGRPSGLPGAYTRFANLRPAATLSCLAGDG